MPMSLRERTVERTPIEDHTLLLFMPTIFFYLVRLFKIHSFPEMAKNVYAPR